VLSKYGYGIEIAYYIVWLAILMNTQRPALIDDIREKIRIDRSLMIDNNGPSKFTKKAASGGITFCFPSW